MSEENKRYDACVTLSTKSKFCEEIKDIREDKEEMKKVVRAEHLDQMLEMLKASLIMGLYASPVKLSVGEMYHVFEEMFLLARSEMEKKNSE